MSDIIPIIISQHAEEAAFLWLLRDNAVFAPNYKIADIKKLDNRLEAHLDGLRIAADPGWDLVQKQVEDRTAPGEVFVAALFAFESGKQDRIDKVLELAAPVPALHRGVVSALGWLTQSQASPHVQFLLHQSVPGLRRIGIGAAVAHQINPGAALEKGLADLDVALRSRALRAVGEMGYTAWTSHLKKELRHADLGCRFSAAWSLARLTPDGAAIAELQTIALTESRYRVPAVNMAIRRMDTVAARRWIHVLDQVPGAQRLAVFAAGVLGDPAEITFLLDRVQTPELARIAGEAFSWITGLDLAEKDLETDAPKGFEAGPNEDPLDERVDLDPDEHLPWPHVEKLKTWWATNRSSYTEGTRYLAGQPMTPESLAAILQTGNQRQRAAAALELGLRNPIQPVFNIRAPGFRQ